MELHAPEWFRGMLRAHEYGSVELIFDIPSQGLDVRAVPIGFPVRLYRSAVIGLQIDME